MAAAAFFLRELARRPGQGHGMFSNRRSISQRGEFGTMVASLILTLPAFCGQRTERVLLRYLVKKDQSDASNKFY